MLADILPPHIAAAEAVGHDPDATLLPEEEAALGRVANGRRRDFTTARACGRRALAELGITPAPILPGPERQPLWPAGVVGSITHCPGYCAAAVARGTEFASVGIDAEVHDALPDGVRDRVARAEEQGWLRVLAGTGVWWDRVLFSAKESVYKAWFPLTGRWLSFKDAVVTVDPEAGRFRARLLVDDLAVDGHVVDGFDGRFLVTGGLILTAVTVARRGRETV